MKTSTRPVAPATVLLVEDERKLAAAILAELKKAGFRVQYAPDGTTALEIFAERPGDLMVLDWMLPDIDGLEVMRRVRGASVMPVLMLTARKEEIDRVVGLEAGADDYLTKPFAMRELIARIRALLRRVQRIARIMETDRKEKSGLVRHGPITVDPEAFQAAVDGRPLDLTRTEFRLLQFLVRNPGRAFSRDYLLDAVWGDDRFIVDRAVDNAVLRLRKKLDLLGDAIETVWGVGYRLRRME